MKRTTLALLVSWLCACASGASETTTKTVDSVKASADSIAAVQAAVVAAPAPVAAPVAASDTNVPRSFVDTAAWVVDARQIDTTESGSAFQCAPRMFTEADTLTLRMSAPHGSWLSVKRPDETTFYLVSPVSGSIPNYSIVQPDSFPNKVMVRFLGGIVSRPGPDNSGAMTGIFGQSGYYQFRVGNDLGTNHAHDVQECTIKLVPRSRY